ARAPTASPLPNAAGVWQHAGRANSGTCMTSKRLCFEPGHKPKCLVIVDDTAEWDRAVYYASRWAIRAGGGVVMLRIIEPEEQTPERACGAAIIRSAAPEGA